MDAVGRHFLSLEEEDDIYCCATPNVNLISSQLGEPYMVNLNSKERIRSAQIQIIDDATVCRQPFHDRPREWCIIICDGSPYTIASKLQQNTYTRMEYLCHINKTETDAHACQSTYELTSDNVLIMPGLGMNKST